MPRINSIPHPREPLYETLSSPFPVPRSNCNHSSSFHPVDSSDPAKPSVQPEEASVNIRGRRREPWKEEPSIPWLVFFPLDRGASRVRNPVSIPPRFPDPFTEQAPGGWLRAIRGQRKRRVRGNTFIGGNKGERKRRYGVQLPATLRFLPSLHYVGYFSNRLQTLSSYSR